MGPLLIALLAVFVFFGLSRWARIVAARERHEERAAAAPEPVRRGHRPLDFDRAAAWFAAPVDDPATVAAAIGLRTASAVDFADGMRGADGGLFVAARGAHVLAVGVDAWHRGDFAGIAQALERLSLAVGEACWFLHDTERLCFGWALARGGVLIRAFCCDGGDETVLWDEGAVDADEAELGFFVADPRDLTGAAIRWWPTRVDVLALAARWSADPRRVPPASGPGLLGRW